jgi:hypothetical protein
MRQSPTRAAADTSVESTAATRPLKGVAGVCDAFDLGDTRGSGTRSRADVPDDAAESRAPQGARRAWPLVERTMTTLENYPLVLHDEV